MIDDSTMQRIIESLIETRPNMGIILRGLYDGLPAGAVASMLPEPLALSEDLRILEALGLIEPRAPDDARRGKNQTP